MTLLQKNEVIDPYIPFTGLGDFAFNDDINAITEYIENQRPKGRQHPKILPLIEKYEQWLAALDWWDKYVRTANTLGQAVTQRDAINKILGEKLDPTRIPGDAMRKIVPTSLDSSVTKIWKDIPFTTKLAGGLVAVLAIFGVVAYKSARLSPVGRVILPRGPNE